MKTLSFICCYSKVIMRTIVDLPDQQIEALKHMSASTRLSRAELMRRAVDEYLARHQPAPDDDAFGLWKKRKTDGVAYQELARAAWGIALRCAWAYPNHDEYPRSVQPTCKIIRQDVYL